MVVQRQRPAALHLVVPPPGVAERHDGVERDAAQLAIDHQPVPQPGADDLAALEAEGSRDGLLEFVAEHLAECLAFLDGHIQFVAVIHRQAVAQPVEACVDPGHRPAHRTAEDLLALPGVQLQQDLAHGPQAFGARRQLLPGIAPQFRQQLRELRRVLQLGEQHAGAAFALEHLRGPGIDLRLRQGQQAVGFGVRVRQHDVGAGVLPPHRVVQQRHLSIEALDDLLDLPPSLHQLGDGAVPDFAPLGVQAAQGAQVAGHVGGEGGGLHAGHGAEAELDVVGGLLPQVLQEALGRLAVRAEQQAVPPSVLQVLQRAVEPRTRHLRPGLVLALHRGDPPAFLVQPQLGLGDQLDGVVQAAPRPVVEEAEQQRPHRAVVVRAEEAD